VALVAMVAVLPLAYTYTTIKVATSLIVSFNKIVLPMAVLVVMDNQVLAVQVVAQVLLFVVVVVVVLAAMVQVAVMAVMVATVNQAH
jgi:hypothetical protein